MGDPFKNTAVTLNTASLKKSATIDPDKWATKTAAYITIAGIVVKGGPGPLGKYSLAQLFNIPQAKMVVSYAQIYKVHFAAIAKVLATVKKFEPIEEILTGIQNNLREYLDSVKSLDSTYSSFPREPLKDLGPAALFLAPALAHDPRFVESWNNFLDSYQIAAQFGSTVAEFLTEEGIKIITETKTRLQELRNFIDSIEDEVSLDKVAKNKYKQQIELLDPLLLRRITESSSRSRELSRQLSMSLNKVKGIQRLK